MILSIKIPLGNNPGIFMSKAKLSRSLLTLWLTPGYWILTATFFNTQLFTCFPGKTARWTWPMEAEAKGLSSKLSNLSLHPSPKFFLIIYSTSSTGIICDVYLALTKALRTGAGIKLSSWILSIWAIFNGAPLILHRASERYSAAFSLAWSWDFPVFFRE